MPSVPTPSGSPSPDRARPALRAALARYRRESPGVRAFVTLRHWLTPLAPILREVPAAGRVLDVGCGHGLFSHALAISSPERAVLGIDPSPAKIAIARRSAEASSNPRFLQVRIEDLDQGSFDTIVILDVLYLLPRAAKLDLLRACRARLSPVGCVVLKTNDTRPRWKLAVTLAQEKLMVALGLTLGGGQLHFFGRAENAALLEEAGFTVEVRELPTWLPYPAVMFLARPRR